MHTEDDFSGKSNFPLESFLTFPRPKKKVGIGNPENREISQLGPVIVWATLYFIFLTHFLCKIAKNKKKKVIAVKDTSIDIVLVEKNHQSATLDSQRHQEKIKQNDRLRVRRDALSFVGRKIKF